MGWPGWWPTTSMLRTRSPSPPSAPHLAAPHLQTFIMAWCISLRSIRDDIEKEHAFQGLCNMIKLNPRAPLEAMLQLCDAIGSWAAPPAACPLHNQS